MPAADTCAVAGARVLDPACRPDVTHLDVDCGEDAYRAARTIASLLAPGRSFVTTHGVCRYDEASMTYATLFTATLWTVNDGERNGGPSLHTPSVSRGLPSPDAAVAVLLEAAG